MPDTQYGTILPGDLDHGFQPDEPPLMICQPVLDPGFQRLHCLVDRSRPFLDQNDRPQARQDPLAEAHGRASLPTASTTSMVATTVATASSSACRIAGAACSSVVSNASISSRCSSTSSGPT